MANDEKIMKELLERVMNATTGTEDSMASQMFCLIVKNNADLVSVAHEMLVKKMYSANSDEALRAVGLLEECMSTGGEAFRNKTAKFTFLNKLIQLVTDQHTGAPVKNDIKKRIMNCLLLWTAEHPDKKKIRDTYEDLKKRNLSFDLNSCTPIANAAVLDSGKRESFLGKDEGLIGKLLRKGGTENYKMANLLIQHRYKLESQRTTAIKEQKCFLNEIGNTVDLLNEMLDNYKEISRTNDDMDIINMLFQKCKSYKEKLELIQNMISEMDDETIVHTTTTVDRLIDCIHKCEELINGCETDHSLSRRGDAEPATVTSVENMSNIDLLNSLVVGPASNGINNVAALTSSNATVDIFALPVKENTEVSVSETNSTDNMWSSMSLLEPIKILKTTDTTDNCPTVTNELVNTTTTTKPKALSEIDKLSEELFNQSLKGTSRKENFTKIETIKPKLKDLVKNVTPAPVHLESNSSKSTTTSADEKFENKIEMSVHSVEDIKPDLSLTKAELVTGTTDVRDKHFLDVDIDLDQLTPLAEGAITLINDGDISAALNFTMDRPMPQVTVIVLTVLNKSNSPIKNFQFHAAVKKPCKVRLLPPTDTDIAVGKPFRPAPPINQVLLLYNPTEQPTDVCCIFKYRLGDVHDEFSDFAIAKDIPCMQ